MSTKASDIEAMARRLCKADGCDPDALAFDAKLPPGPMGTTLLVANFNEFYVMPLWKFYARMAEAAL